MNSIDSILITGAYGTKNLGDDKILSGLTKLCRGQYDPDQVIAASIDPASTKSICDVDDAIPNLERDPVNWIRTVRHVDLIIIGGGTVVCTPFARRHGLISVIGHLTGTEVYVIAGVGTGKEIDVLLSKKYLALVDAIAVRDFQSRRELTSIGVQTPIDVVPDPGFVPEERYSYESFDKIDQDYILVCVRHMDHTEDGVDIRGLASGLDRINESMHQEILFFPFHRSGVSDIDFSRGVMKKMDTDAVLFDKRYSIEEAELVLSDADAVVAMRLRSMILSARNRTPLVPIEYTPKCGAFLEMIGATESLEYSTIDPSELYSKMRFAIEEGYPITGGKEEIRDLEDDCWKIFPKCDYQERENELSSVPIVLTIVSALFLKRLGEGLSAALKELVS